MRRLIGANRVLAAVLVIGVLARVVLLPLWHGQDFTVWTLASAATVHGTNIYTDHPAYPGGPFAYLPLFLYVETAMYWLAGGTHLSFVILGKLPMLAADTAIALVLYRTLLRRGRSPHLAGLVVALFYLNPLVLYNSALYGRFDSIACLLLLLSTLRPHPRDRDAGWFGLAVAAKTFPLFTLASFLVATPPGKRLRKLAIAFAVVLAICLPYLTSATAVLRDAALYDNNKTPQGMSWWTLLPDSTSGSAAGWADLGFVAFAIGSVFLARRIAPISLETAVAATLVLFVALNKVVLEQYLIWPLPWLVLLCASADRLRVRASLAIVGVLTVAGLLDNESFHPLGRACPILGVALAGCGLAYVAVLAGRRARVAPTPSVVRV